MPKIDVLEKVYKYSYKNPMGGFVKKAFILAERHLRPINPGDVIAPSVYNRIVEETAMFMSIGARLKRNQYILVGAIVGGLIVYTAIKIKEDLK
jgi:hypothetical protein